MLRNSIYKTRRTNKGDFKSMKPKVSSNTTKNVKSNFMKKVLWLFYHYYGKVNMKFMVSATIIIYCEVVFSLTNNLNSCLNTWFLFQEPSLILLLQCGQC